MTPLGWIATMFLVVAVLAAPRKWAPVYLLAACILLTPNQSIVLAGLRFPVLRILILFGCLRVLARGERPAETTRLDKLVGWLLGWSLFISFFQPFEDGSGPVYAAGTAINVGGVYFLLRTWVPVLKELRLLLGALAFLLVPLASVMVGEQLTGRNAFGLLGGVSQVSMVRDGRIRANGSFRHPILAGTVGAACFPLMLALYQQRKLAGSIGMASAVAIVLASRSSGPAVSLIVAVAFLFLWRYRRAYRTFYGLGIGLYLLAELVMSKPAYYLIARIDLSGGSTGYHRVYLLDAFFKYFNEWWLRGTTYTRHWMQFGVSYSDKHTDITNYYIAWGINGGLVAVVLLLLIVLSAVRAGPQFSRAVEFRPTSDAFLTWCLASGMAAHGVTSISVSYFDQSMCFFWMNVALLGTVQATLRTTSPEE
jgi:hypothetical protein